MGALYPDLLYGARPIITFGQSNIAGGYTARSSWPIRLQHEQPAIWAYHRYCHNTGGAAIATRNDWHRVQPFQLGVPAVGELWGNWEMDLCDALYGIGERAAIMAWEMGGNPLGTWVPGIGQYASEIKPFVAARMAELTAPKAPLLVMYQGESGLGGPATWAAGMTSIAAAVRADFGVDGIVVVRLPATYTFDDSVAIAASQADYVASDARSRLAYNHGSTFIGDATHLDYASARSLAIGPDNDGTVRSVLTCIKELLA
jgi:hypothetical protein